MTGDTLLHFIAFLCFILATIGGQYLDSARLVAFGLAMWVFTNLV